MGYDYDRIEIGNIYLYDKQVEAMRRYMITIDNMNDMNVINTFNVF